MTAPERTAIVTGGGSGIGLAISERLAADGCAVAIFDRDGAAAEATAAKITAGGGRAAGVRADVTQRPEIDAGVERVRRELGAATVLVNSAGLEAPALARSLAGVPEHTIPPAYFCRGVYFTLSGRAPFQHLVYPVPEAAGLGVHLTLDLAGQARFGPDTEWIDGIDYTVEPKRGDRFYAAIRRYWPALKDGALQPGYAGIRPKISGPAEPSADFLVQGPAQHGVPGLVNLYGIESPGLTASLELADAVVRALDAKTPVESSAVTP